MKFEKKNLKSEYKFIFWVEKLQLKMFVFATLATMLLVGLFALIRMGVKEQKFVTPLPSGGIEEVEQTPEPSAKSDANKDKEFWTGIASWYGTGSGECVGCAPYYDENGQKYYIMSNQEKLNDDKRTLAFNELPLNTVVKVRNMKNDLVVKAKVTDRHGADNAKYGFRIADLSKATKSAIGCEGLCKVRIYN